MSTRLVAYLVLSAAVLASCGKDDEKPATRGGSGEAAKPPATQPATQPPATRPAATQPAAQPAADEKATLALDTLGVQLDTPASWTMKKLNDNAYVFRLPSSKSGNVSVAASLDVRRAMKMPESVESAAKSCGGNVTERKTIDGRGFYFTCEQEAAGQKIISFQYFMQVGNGAVSCNGSGADVAPTLAACMTLRPL